MKEMKTLTLSGVTYEIVDQKSRDNIGNLADLATETKASLVAAINEVARRSGGTVNETEVQRIVEEYLAENPPAKGEPGESPTVSVELATDGYKITITDIDGQKSFNLYHGKTPQKGVDYFTADDINAIAKEAAKLVEPGSGGGSSTEGSNAVEF